MVGPPLSPQNGRRHVHFVILSSFSASEVYCAVTNIPFDLFQSPPIKPKQAISHSQLPPFKKRISEGKHHQTTNQTKRSHPSSKIAEETVLVLYSFSSILIRHTHTHTHTHKPQQTNRHRSQTCLLCLSSLCPLRNHLKTNLLSKKKHNSIHTHLRTLSVHWGF